MRHGPATTWPWRSTSRPSSSRNWSWKARESRQIRQARSALAQAQAQYELVKNGPRKEDIDQGRARVAQAQAALKLAETQLSYATVYAPLTGVVLSKNIEPGEYVAPGTAVVTVGDLVNVWLRAYIEETDLGRVSVKQRAWVTTDTLPRQEVRRPRVVHCLRGRVYAEERADAKGASQAGLSHQDRHHERREDDVEAGHAGRRDDRTDYWQGWRQDSRQNGPQVVERPMYVAAGNG